MRRYLFQTKEQGEKNLKRQLLKHNLSDKEFKSLVKGMLTELGERKDAYSEFFIKELENIKKNQ